MSVLYKTLLRENLVYLCICLFCCIGIYLLVDVFERLDNFLGAGASVEITLSYFLLKTPLIVSQILPAVFLLALIVQLSLMKRNRELLALETGGVSFKRIIFFFLVYALVWVLIQLLFSQFFGVMGQQKSEEIWSNLGKDKEAQERVVRDTWFKQGDVIVFVDKYFPSDKELQGLQIFYLHEEYSGINKIVSSRGGSIENNKWSLEKVQEFLPDRFLTRNKDSFALDIDKSAQSFMLAKEKEDPEQLSLWKLGDMISGLKQTGVNVEVFTTTWHKKIAYAFSVLVLTLLGLCICRLWENIFWNITVGVVMIFIYYGVYVMGGTMGKNGLVPPWVGGWMAVMVLGSASLCVLFMANRK